jgi:UDP-N-acetyl-D-mannosaminuronic acid dehydrogenase
MKVCILGLGYVGLTLALGMADSGIKVTGIDTNKKTIELLNRKISTVHENDLPPLLEKYLNNNLIVAETIPSEEFDVFIVGVGTPLDNNGEPVIDHVINACEEIASKIKKTNLVILRSTVPVGTTRKVVKPIIESKSGLTAGHDFDLIFAPERTLEGVAISELKKNPQIIGSLNDSGIDKAIELFSMMTDTTVPVSSLETAEMIKLIDNTYRDVHFAFANELALICESLKIDVHECITKANYNYPRNKVPIPSPGVGGPCLTKDPLILSYVSNSLGYKPNLILHSRWINEYVPKHIAMKITRKLEDLGKHKTNSKIFIIGFAFKGNPETGDYRNSSTLILVDELKKNFPEIYGYDPIVTPEEIENLGVTPTNVQEGFKNADCIVIMNNHKSYLSFDMKNLLNDVSHSCLFLDCWNMFRNISNDERIIYSGVGLD